MKRGASAIWVAGFMPDNIHILLHAALNLPITTIMPSTQDQVHPAFEAVILFLLEWAVQYLLAFMKCSKGLLHLSDQFWLHMALGWWWLKSPGVVWVWKSLLFLLCALLGKKDCMDVWQDTSRCDGDLAKQLAQLLIIPDCKLNVPGNNPGLLVVLGSIACQLKDLSGQILQHSCQVDWCSCSNPGCILALLQVASHTPHWKLQQRDLCQQWNSHHKTRTLCTII